MDDCEELENENIFGPSRRNGMECPAPRTGQHGCAADGKWDTAGKERCQTVGKSGFCENNTVPGCLIPADNCRDLPNIHFRPVF